MLEYIINKPICVDLAEKRIIENCVVTINAPITIYGKLIFRNCTITDRAGEITIYGSLKIEASTVFAKQNFLHIMDGGKYLFDSLEFNDGNLDWTNAICHTENGQMHWIIKRQSVSDFLEEAIISCVLKRYNIDEPLICDSNMKNCNKEQKEIQTEARNVAIYLLQKLTDISSLRIAQRFGIYHELMDYTLKKVDEFIKNGDKALWQYIAEITEKICNMIYEKDLADEEAYPFRD